MSSEALERAAKESRASYVKGTPEQYPKAELRGFTILEAEALLAALAVAREREQRAIEALDAAAEKLDVLRRMAVNSRTAPNVFESIADVATWARDDARAALVDEPAAAGTSTTHREASMRLDGDAKPPAGVPADGEEGAVRQQGTGRGPGDAATADDPGQPVAPAAATLACPECGEPLQLGHDCLAGSASAAADDPMCSYCEIRLSEHEAITANCEEVERAAADEPGETPA